MKPPTNQKEVREFLGMVGYYRKFISRFADAARPMTKLTKKDTKFEWSDDSQVLSIRKPALFSLLFSNIQIYRKDMLHSLMPVIKLQAAAVLTLEYKDDDNEIKEISIAYLSAQFSDTQFKYSTVVKEGYAIY